MEPLNACFPCFVSANAFEAGLEVNCDVKAVGESSVFVDLLFVWDLCEVEVVSQHCTCILVRVEFCGKVCFNVWNSMTSYGDCMCVCIVEIGIVQCPSMIRVPQFFLKLFMNGEA